MTFKLPSLAKEGLGEVLEGYSKEPIRLSSTLSAPFGPSAHDRGQTEGSTRPKLNRSQTPLNPPSTRGDVKHVPEPGVFRQREVSPTEETPASQRPADDPHFRH